MTLSTASRTSIVPIDSAYDRPDELLRLVRESGPYWNQSRYIPNGAMLGPGHPLVAPDGPPGFPATPVFRADWFRRTDSTPDGRRLAFHEPFLAAARVVHGGPHVVPLLVHVNLNAPGPTADAGHLDVPAFRGLDLRTAPGWLLLGLARTGLAAPWRLRVATAISWLYRGPGGGLTYWPDGPQSAPVTVTDLWNRAVVLDADSVHHRVESVGRPGTPAAAVTRQSSIAVAEEDGVDRWVVDDAERPTSYALDAVRVSVSWKAAVFPSADERDRYIDGRDPLTVEHAADLLAAEVRHRGADLPEGVALDDVRFADAVEMVVPRVRPLPGTEARS